MTLRNAIGKDECGDEFVVTMRPGQTLNDIRGMYPECRFTHTEEVRDKAYYMTKYADPDYDPHYDPDERQAEYDRQWR